MKINGMDGILLLQHIGFLKNSLPVATSKLCPQILLVDLVKGLLILKFSWTSM